MAQQTFHAAEPSRVPHTATIDGFFVDGRTNDDGEPEKWSLDLSFRPVAPWTELNKVLTAFSTVDGELVLNGLDIQRFLLAVASDDSRKAFAELLGSESWAVDVATLAAVVIWLIPLYTGNPTTR